MSRVIYMDHHATTPVDPRVVDAMLPYFTEKFGNAASRTHRYGWEAEQAVDAARRQVAGLIGAKPTEIIFTSGATESDNLAIKGVVGRYADKGNHIVTATTEHKAVLDSCKALEKAGQASVTVLKVSATGEIDPEDVRAAITDETVLISLMLANNEIGTIHDIAAIGAIAREHGVLFHTDATQGVGILPIDVDAMNVDLLSLTAHKIYGPKGCGALYVRSQSPRVRVDLEMHGGGQERGMRSGTLNVPGIVGLGRACEIFRETSETDATHVRTLRGRLKEKLFGELNGLVLHGHPERRLPGNLSLGIEGVDGESMLMALDDVAVSSGSACSSTTLEPSYVLRAIGVSDRLAHSTLRFGLGRFNTEEEVDHVAERIVREATRLRGLGRRTSKAAAQ